MKRLNQLDTNKVRKTQIPHSVKFNVLMNMILTSSSFLFPLITIPYASRVLSTYGMGAVAFAQSSVSYFSLAALLGIQYYGVRTCAAVRDDLEELSKTVKEILIILLISTSIVSVLYIICIFTVPQFINEQLLFIQFGITIWLTSFGLEWFYQALEQYGYITVRNVIFKLIALIFMFIFVTTRDDYIIYGAIVIFAGGASNILNMLRVRKLIDFKTHHKLNVKRHLKPMKWFTIAAISSGMYTQIDIVLLGFLGTTYMVGIYQLVAKIKSVLVSAVNAAGNVVLPRLSYYQAQHKDKEAGLLISKNMNFSTLLGMSIIALLCICSRQIVLILAGPDFMESTIPLMIIGPAALFSALNIVLANHMISNQRERPWAVVNVIGFTIAAISNTVLIPILGVNGAALSISLCEGSMFVMRCVICRAFLSTIRHLLDPVKILICAGLAACGGFGASNVLQSQNIVVHLIGSSLTFGCLYLAFLVISKEQFITPYAAGIWHRISRHM
jgi:O-antigen/teichoic acid export membrane protein